MSAKCIKEMLSKAKKLNLSLTEREAAEIFRNIQKASNVGKRDGLTNKELQGSNSKTQLVEFARRAHENKVNDAQEALRRKYIQIQKSAELSGRITSAGKGKAVEALNNEVFKAGQMKEVLEAESLANIADAVEEYKKFFGYRVTNEQALNVVREIGNPGSTGDAAANKLAKAWQKISSDSRNRLNQAGADIGLLKDWIMPQIWNGTSMRKIGGSKFVDDAMLHIDRSRYYDAVTGRQLTDPEIRDVITEYYETITTDGLNQPVDELTGIRGQGSLGKRLGDEHRALHFKNADSWYTMTQAYGEHDVFSLMFAAINKNANNLALLEKFGPNPNIAFQSALNVAKHVNQSKKGTWMADNYFAELNGTNNLPVNEMFANIMQGLRQWMVATKLGSMFLSQANDAAVFTTMARSDGMGMGGAIRILGKSLAAGKEGRLEAARQGVYAQVMINDSALRYGEATKGHKLTARAASATIKLGAGNKWDDGGKRGYSALIGNHLSLNSKKSFGDMDTTLLKVLKRYDITEADWNIIRKSTPVQILGESLITPTSIKLLGDTPNIRKAALKVMDLMITESNIAMPTPGLRERALTKLGTRPGSVPGEFLRSIFLFKTFSLTMLTKVLPRLFNKEALKTTRGAGLAAQFALSMIAMGAVSTQLKQIAKGNDPLDMTQASFWGKAFAQSGGAGIIGDFITSDVNRYNGGFVATLAGPLGGAVEDLTKLTLGNARKAAEGKKTSVGKNLVRIAGGNIPIVNLWYTKAAISHLLLQQAQEYVNPGYGNRMRRKQLKQSNQGQWWPSGQLLPERAPAIEDIRGGRR